jgi:hypothetical protein
VVQEPGEETKKVASPDDDYYDLQMLWRVAQDSNTMTENKTKELALNCLIEVIKVGIYLKPEMRDPFIEAASNNITNGDTVYFSIQFLQNLLSTYPNDDSRLGGGQSS